MTTISLALLLFDDRTKVIVTDCKYNDVRMFFMHYNIVIHLPNIEINYFFNFEYEKNLRMQILM